MAFSFLNEGGGGCDDAALLTKLNHAKPLCIKNRDAEQPPAIFSDRKLIVPKFSRAVNNGAGGKTFFTSTSFNFRHWHFETVRIRWYPDVLKPAKGRLGYENRFSDGQTGAHRSTV
jgi:hypothetical protein